MYSQMKRSRFRLTIFLIWVFSGLHLFAQHPAFRLEERNGVWWLIQPDGETLFSKGVCCVNGGIEWDKYDTANPGYAAWHHFSNPDEWACSTMDSLKSWGFTTIGGWSDLEVFTRSPKMDMPFTSVLSIGASAGAPWFDMWDSTVIGNMDKSAQIQIPKIKNHSYLLGYYSDNELGWWNGPLLRLTWQAKPGSANRNLLIKLIRDKYGSDWQAVMQDFEAENALDFSELEKGGRLYLRGGGDGIKVINKFVLLTAERYYEITSQLIRKYDTRGLLLGDRYQSFYYPEVVRAAGRHLDVVSTNFNVHWNDGVPARYFLTTMYALAQKPLMIGEIYMTAMKNRSGNMNNSAAFPVVNSQSERVHGFINTANMLASLPFVVGFDWFQFYDEPTHGRFDGENFNMGLIDIHGKPYEQLTGASRNLDLQKVHAQKQQKISDASAGIPPAPDQPIIMDWKLILKTWDRMHGFIPAATPFPVADLYACWTPDTLYLGLLTDDVFETDFYRDGVIPEADRMRLQISISGYAGQADIRMGAGRPPVSCLAEAKVTDLHISKSTRHFSIVRLPAKLFNKHYFSAGERIRCVTELHTLARSQHMKWNLDYRLAEKFNDE